ncbi:hypothetical protein [Paraburkholderia sp. JHI869]|uniref:hypothetical protein n=1 Tax=Paraburkholderia sp. JHI869 TaxID=3112959 RepID=UPI00316BF7E1
MSSATHRPNADASASKRKARIASRSGSRSALASNRNARTADSTDAAAGERKMRLQRIIKAHGYPLPMLRSQPLAFWFAHRHGRSKPKLGNALGDRQAAICQRNRGGAIEVQRNVQIQIPQLIAQACDFRAGRWTPRIPTARLPGNQ